jgi:hypothetical protein
MQPGSSDPSFLDAFLCPLLDCYKGFSPYLTRGKPPAPSPPCPGNNRKPWKSIEIYENECKCMKTYANLWWKSIEIHRKSMEINEHLWKSNKIYETIIKIVRDL